MTKAEQCIQWIKDYFKDNPDGKAIIGISGGKDSTIAAALCVEALGADRVIGVMMPNGKQNDISDSKRVCELLGIIPLTVNVGNACTVLMDWIAGAFTFEPHDKKYIEAVNEVINNPMIKTNLPARIRMTTLYAIAALYPNSRVVNTCNRSEDFVGYSTKYGDAAGDFSPLGNLTVREVLEIGDELGLPRHLVHKAPSDGMCGKTDEDNLGFTYEELDGFLLGESGLTPEVMSKVARLHKSTRHKYAPMPTFDPNVYNCSLFSSTKRGLRAESGIIIDEYADGGLVDPSVTAAAMSGKAVVTGVDLGEPAAAVNVEPNLDNAIESIEKSMWKSIREQAIKGMK